MTLNSNDVVNAIRSGLIIRTIDVLLLENHDISLGIFVLDASLNLSDLFVGKSKNSDFSIFEHFQMHLSAFRLEVRLI